MLALERGAASMGAAVAIGRLDMTASALRAAASREKDGAAARRILALALVLDGADRKTAAETCGMDRQTLRDWVHRYNAEGLTGLHDLTPPGPKPKLTAEQQAELAGLNTAVVDSLKVLDPKRPIREDCSTSSSNPIMEGHWCRFRREARAREGHQHCSGG